MSQFIQQYITQEQLQDLYGGMGMSESEDRLGSCGEDRLREILGTFDAIAPHVTQANILRGELSRRELF